MFDQVMYMNLVWYTSCESVPGGSCLCVAAEAATATGSGWAAAARADQRKNASTEKKWQTGRTEVHEGVQCAMRWGMAGGSINARPLQQTAGIAATAAQSPGCGCCGPPPAGCCISAAISCWRRPSGFFIRWLATSGDSQR